MNTADINTFDRGADDGTPKLTKKIGNTTCGGHIHFQQDEQGNHDGQSSAAYSE